MQHLPCPESYRSNLPEVPYLETDNKYEREGFWEYMKKSGMSEKTLRQTLEDIHDQGISHQTHRDQLRPLNCFLQQWAWFALLHEFEMACGVTMDHKDLVKENGPSGRILDTSLLPGYVRSVVLAHLQAQGTAWDLKPGEIVRPRIPNVKGSTRLWNRKPSIYGEELFEIVEEKPSLSYSIRDLVTGLVLEHPVSARFLSRVKSKTSSSNPKQEHQQNYALASKNALEKSVPMATLLDLLDAPHQRQLASSKRSNEKSTGKLLSCISSVERVLASAWLHDFSAIYPEIPISISVLGESIRTVALLVLEERLGFSLFPIKALSHSVWCKSRPGPTVIEFSPTLQVIASVLPIHHNDDHSRCTNKDCTLLAEHASAFETKHSYGCDIVNCKEACVPEQELIDVLADGGNPCLLLEGNGKKLVVSDIRKEKYVAISHVWRHGLGNPAQNSIPWCQITRLFRLLHNCNTEAKALWLDTLTVPINIDYKFEAIKQLRAVYQNAEAVLVLDHVLQQVGAEPLEQSIQLLCCEWLTRLWTLQEGRLASKLLFEFKNEVVSEQQLINFDIMSTDEMVFTQLGILKEHLQLRLKQTDDPTKRFGNLMIDLAHRKVTVPSDEPICIATMLGLSLENLYDKSTKQISLSDILRALPNQLPLDLIFVESPRIQEPGLCWAPASLLTSKHPTWTPISETGVLDSMGFNVSMDCFLLEKNFRIRGTTDNSVLHSVRSSFHKASFYFDIETATLPSRQTIKRAAIIIQNPNLRSNSVSYGALVELIEVPEVVTDWPSAGTRPPHVANMKWHKLDQWLPKKPKTQQCNFLGLVRIIGNDFIGMYHVSSVDLVETKATFHQQRKFRLS